LRPVTALAGFGALVAIGMAHVLTSETYGRPERPFPRVSENVSGGNGYRAEFSFCVGPVRANCVVDGDTFWFEGTKIRIADIDAPEIVTPQCAAERQAGEAAKRKLRELLNVGSFSLVAGWRDEDRFGRKLRIVARDDRSLGEMLAREGLARRWEGARLAWCDGRPTIGERR
jgi:micrococcal nuclease